MTLGPFDFVVTFLAFVYALALAHVLLAAMQMIRRRRELVFDWAHALWMVAALMVLWANWLALWDLHSLRNLTLPTVAIGFLYVVMLYAVCALVSPDLRDGDVDMARFHRTQGRTYIGAFVVLFVITIPVNYLGAAGLSLESWARQNGLVVAMLISAIVPLVFRARWVQVVAPIAMIALTAAFMMTFYYVLR